MSSVKGERVEKLDEWRAVERLGVWKSWTRGKAEQCERRACGKAEKWSSVEKDEHKK